MRRIDLALLLPLVVPEGACVPLSLTPTVPLPRCTVCTWADVVAGYWLGLAERLKGERRN